MWSCGIKFIYRETYDDLVLTSGDGAPYLYTLGKMMAFVIKNSNQIKHLIAPTN